MRCAISIEIAPQHFEHGPKASGSCGIVRRKNANDFQNLLLPFQTGFLVVTGYAGISDCLALNVVSCVKQVRPQLRQIKSSVTAACGFSFQLAGRISAAQRRNGYTKSCCSFAYANILVHFAHISIILISLNLTFEVQNSSFSMRFLHAVGLYPAEFPEELAAYLIF